MYVCHIHIHKIYTYMYIFHIYKYICVCIYIYIIYIILLEWLTGYNTANPTMAAYKHKVQESSSYSVHETGYLSWSSVYSRISKK